MPRSRAPVGRPAANPALRIVLVSDNAETLDGLQTYLGRAGVTTTCARSLGSIPNAPASAVVVFPDDYPFDKVIDRVLSYTRLNCDVLIVLVTSQPKRYTDHLRGFALARDPLVIPRPAWGWTILDAMRGHVESRLDDQRG